MLQLMSSIGLCCPGNNDVFRPFARGMHIPHEPHRCLKLPDEALGVEYGRAQPLPLQLIPGTSQLQNVSYKMSATKFLLKNVE